MNYSLAKGLVFFCYLISFADENAMFGLRWGMSPIDVTAVGIDLMRVSNESNLYLYACDTLPKNPVIARHYFLTFDEDSSLVKIKMKSVNITDDLYGDKGKGKFDHFLSLLRTKYRVESVLCTVGGRSYEGSDEFYQCLRHTGCGYWQAVLRDCNKTIVLKLEGVDRGVGFISITVEAVPGFGKALKKAGYPDMVRRN
jgi:hypothetical protein